MHPAKEGFSALPFFDEFDLSTVDILLISQYVKFPYSSYINEAMEFETKWETSHPLLVYDQKLNTVQCHAPFSLFLQFSLSLPWTPLDILSKDFLRSVQYRHLRKWS
jgi:hypothetical protein